MQNSSFQNKVSPEFWNLLIGWRINRPACKASSQRTNLHSQLDTYGFTAIWIWYMTTSQPKVLWASPSIPGEVHNPPGPSWKRPRGRPRSSWQEQLGRPSVIDGMWDKAVGRGHRRSARRTFAVYADDWLIDWIWCIVYIPHHAMPQYPNSWSIGSFMVSQGRI